MRVTFETHFNVINGFKLIQKLKNSLISPSSLHRIDVEIESKMSSTKINSYHAALTDILNCKTIIGGKQFQSKFSI